MSWLVTRRMTKRRTKEARRADGDVEMTCPRDVDGGDTYRAHLISEESHARGCIEGRYWARCGWAVFATSLATPPATDLCRKCVTRSEEAAAQETVVPIKAARR